MGKRSRYRNTGLSLEERISLSKERKIKEEQEKKAKQAEKLSMYFQPAKKRIDEDKQTPAIQ